MQRLLTWLYLAYFFLSSALLVCVSALICLVTAPFDARRRAVHSFSCWWGYHYVQINPLWKCTFEGMDYIDPNKTYVLVANHQSFADIILLYGLHKPFKWVSKESVFKIPFVGWNMFLNQYVLIKRGDLKSIKEMMQTCRDWLKLGISVIIFPEGTRSKDGQLQAFRDGAFRLAIDCNVPLVPIVIDGTHEALPKHGRLIRFKKDVRVKILAPIDCSQFEGSSGTMRTYVHQLMEDTLANMRGASATAKLPPTCQTLTNKVQTD